MNEYTFSLHFLLQIKIFNLPQLKENHPKIYKSEFLRLLVFLIFVIFMEIDLFMDLTDILDFGSYSLKTHILADVHFYHIH